MRPAGAGLTVLALSLVVGLLPRSAAFGCPSPLVTRGRPGSPSSSRTVRRPAPKRAIVSREMRPSRLPDANDKDFARALGTAEVLVRGVRSRTASDGSMLNLETHFFDSSTGLHSEGVWHNSLMGIACMALTISGRAAKDVQEAPKRIASSLMQHSWDGVSFRRRAHSGNWDHDSEPAVQPAFYQKSAENRCVQHGIALLFFSLLREVQPDCEISQEYASIAATFLDQFFDEEASCWTTISRKQGVATGSRPSASSASVTIAGGGTGEGLFEDVGGENQVYYRAVDNAIALLALVSMVRYSVTLARQKMRHTCDSFACVCRTSGGKKATRSRESGSRE